MREYVKFIEKAKVVDIQNNIRIVEYAIADFMEKNKGDISSWENISKEEITSMVEEKFEIKNQI